MYYLTTKQKVAFGKIIQEIIKFCKNKDNVIAKLKEIITKYDLILDLQFCDEYGFNNEMKAIPNNTKYQFIADILCATHLEGPNYTLQSKCVLVNNNVISQKDLFTLNIIMKIIIDYPGDFRKIEISEHDGFLKATCWENHYQGEIIIYLMAANEYEMKVSNWLSPLEFSGFLSTRDSRIESWLKESYTKYKEDFPLTIYDTHYNFDYDKYQHLIWFKTK